jgi:putative tryptophan/tyrosine transport system substrate-binding protein
LQAVLAASRTIPVVVWAINYDPVALGYVHSLVRPGGNVTGIVSLQTELAAKQVELLTQAFPGRTRLGILWDQISGDQFAAAEPQARLLSLDVQSLKLERPPYDFDAAFQRLGEGSPQMLLVLSSPFFGSARSRIAELAIQQRPHVVWRECAGQLSSARFLRGQDIQRGEACRSPRRAGGKV